MTSLVYAQISYLVLNNKWPNDGGDIFNNTTEISYLELVNTENILAECDNQYLVKYNNLFIGLSKKGPKILTLKEWIKLSTETIHNTMLTSSKYSDLLKIPPEDCWKFHDNIKQKSLNPKQYNSFGPEQYNSFQEKMKLYQKEDLIKPTFKMITTSNRSGSSLSLYDGMNTHFDKLLNKFS